MTMATSTAWYPVTAVRSIYHRGYYHVTWIYADGSRKTWQSIYPPN